MTLARGLALTILSFAWTTGFAPAAETHGQSPASSTPAVPNGIVRIVNQQGNEYSIGSGTLVEQARRWSRADVCARVFRWRWRHPRIL